MRWLADYGVRLLAGTDAGLPGSIFTDIKTRLFRHCPPRRRHRAGALQIYQRYGFSPAQILEPVTVNPAEALDLAHRTGQLRTGYDADVLVIHGDPLADLTALSNIKLRAARGRISDTQQPGTVALDRSYRHEKRSCRTAIVQRFRRSAR